MYSNWRFVDAVLYIETGLDQGGNAQLLQKRKRKKRKEILTLKTSIKPKTILFQNDSAHLYSTHLQQVNGQFLVKMVQSLFVIFICFFALVTVHFP